MKKNMFILIVGIIIGSAIGVFAYNYNAKNVSYDPEDTNWNVTTVEDAINSLKNGNKFCELKSGPALTAGSMYECDPGDGVKRNFYVLVVDKDRVDLILERNITDTVGNNKTLSWNDAMDFFINGAGKNIPNSWKNVLSVDLPTTNQIAIATNYTNWNAVADTTEGWWCFASKTRDMDSNPVCNTNEAVAYNYLYDYLKNCNGCTHNEGEASGYWTRDVYYKIASSVNLAWQIDRRADLSVSGITDPNYRGVRPVITVLKNNLK